MRFLSVLNLLGYAIVYAFSVVLLIYCVASWFIRDPFNKFMLAVRSIVDPVLNPIRNFLYRSSTLRNLPIDLSVIIAYFLCQLIMEFFTL